MEATLKAAGDVVTVRWFKSLRLQGSLIFCGVSRFDWVVGGGWLIVIPTAWHASQVRLEKFDPTSKIKLIKEVRTVLFSPCFLFYLVDSGESRGKGIG